MGKLIRPTRLLTVLLAVLVIVGAMSVASRAEAQSSPLVAYGIGLEPGTTVTASAGGIACETVLADADGNWLMMIEAAAPCAPEGRTVAFFVNGAPSGISVQWSAGGTPETSGYPAETGLPLMMPSAPAAAPPVPTTNAPATTAPSASALAPAEVTQPQIAPASAPANAVSTGAAVDSEPAPPLTEIDEDAPLPIVTSPADSGQHDVGASRAEQIALVIERLYDGGREVGATSIITAVLLAILGLSGMAWAVTRFGRA